MVAWAILNCRLGRKVLIACVNYDLIFKNVGKDVDNRGYYLVERWVLSIIQTENPAKVIGEGLTKIKNIGTLKEISDSCPEKVFRNYPKSGRE